MTRRTSSAVAAESITISIGVLSFVSEQALSIEALREGRLHRPKPIVRGTRWRALDLAALVRHPPGGARLSETRGTVLAPRVLHGPRIRRSSSTLSGPRPRDSRSPRRRAGALRLPVRRPDEGRLAGPRPGAVHGQGDPRDHHAREWNRHADPAGGSRRRRHREVQPRKLRERDHVEHSAADGVSVAQPGDTVGFDAVEPGAAVRARPAERTGSSRFSTARTTGRTPFGVFGSVTIRIGARCLR